MGSYTFRWSHHAEEVFVTGTFDDWSKSVKLEKVNGGFEKYVNLPSAEHKILYKFVVDGHWTPDYGLACENDGSGNVNNVLHPGDLGRQTTSTQTTSPQTTSTRMPGPYMPASNTMESQQSYGVNPLPATSGTRNPVDLPEGESVPHHSNYTTNTLGSNVTLDKESYERSDRYPGSNPTDSQQSFGVNPLPATSGFRNPVELPAGESVPHHSNYTTNTLDSNVTLDKESYERSDRYPGAEPTGTDGTSDAFSVPAVTSTMIPESSLPLGADAAKGLEQDTHPFIRSSAGAETSTAALAGQVPKEPRGVPSMVSESQREAHYAPEASASAEAVSEKKEVEQELLSKVPTEPATSEGAATAGGDSSAPASSVPQVVADSQYDANVAPEASGNAEAVAEKEEVETELKSKVPEEPATSETTAGESSTGETSTEGIAGYLAAGSAAVAASTAAMASTASSWMPASLQHAMGLDAGNTEHSTTTEQHSAPTGQRSTATESGVPSSVTESYSEAHREPEAMSNPEAVGEKSAVERELLEEVPRTEESGEPAPTAGQRSTTTESGVPSSVTESYSEAHREPEAMSNPEAVGEKSAVERELLEEVPRTEESGQPAPTASASLSSTAPTTTGTTSYAKETTSPTSYGTATTGATSYPTESISNISGTGSTLFSGGLGSVAARVFAAPVDNVFATTDTYTSSVPTYATSSLPTETSTAKVLPYPETSMATIPTETETSAPVVTSLEKEIDPTSTAKVTETPVEPSTTITPDTTAMTSETAAIVPETAATVPETTATAPETTTTLPETTTALPETSTTSAAPMTTGTSATTSGLNAPASAPAQTLATEAKQIASGGPEKTTTTPKKTETTATGTKSMAQAMKATRQDSRDVSPTATTARSPASAAAQAAAATAASSSTPTKSGWQTSAQTPEKTKTSAPATSSSANSTPASASSASAAAAKEDKRRKRTSFFGKLKEKFSSK